MMAGKRLRFAEHQMADFLSNREVACSLLTGVQHLFVSALSLETLHVLF